MIGENSSSAGTGVKWIAGTVSHSPSPELIREALRSGSESQLLKALVEAFPGSWFFTRLDGSFAYVNESACHALGYTREELLKLRIFDVNPSLTPEIWAVIGLENPSNRGVFRTFHRRKDNTTFPVEAYGTQLQLDGERVALAYVIDLSEESDVRKQLAEREQLLQTVLQAAPVALFSTDAQGRMQLAEGSAVEALGVDRHAVLGQRVQTVFSEAQELVFAVENAQLGQMSEGLVRVGSSQFEFRVRPVRDENGLISGTVGVATDVTRRMKAEAETQLLQERLQQAQKMEAIGRLAAGVAHDFNNLIQIIGGGVEACQVNPTSSSNAILLAGMQDACERAARFVAQLLTVGRQDHSKRSFIHLGELIGGMLPMLRRMVGPGIELTFQELTVALVVSVDPVQIEQLMLNLCVNARDAMPNGGKLVLTLKSEFVVPSQLQKHNLSLAGQYVVLLVSDTGVGISPEISRQIFEPFFTTKGEVGGTGLGLATVYAVVQSHGGAVEVESELGQGTQFAIYLPVAAPNGSAL